MGLIGVWTGFLDDVDFVHDTNNISSLDIGHVMWVIRESSAKAAGTR